METRQPVTLGDLDHLDQDALRALAAADLAWLADLLPLLGRLTDTHQRGLGFLTVTGRAALDQQIRKERAARLPNLQAGIVITGEVPAPGNITAVSLAGEVPLRLLDVRQTMRNHLRRTGTPDPQMLPAQPTVTQIRTDVTRLLRLVHARDVLFTVARDVADITERVWNFVHGNDRTDHPKPCPHCGRRSLVVYLTKGLIRCEPDDQQPCVCDDSYCNCKVRHHTHEWHRDTPPSKKWSWRTLARDQKRAETTPTQ